LDISSRIIYYLVQGMAMTCMDAGLPVIFIVLTESE